MKTHSIFKIINHGLYGLGDFLCTIGRFSVSPLKSKSPFLRLIINFIFIGFLASLSLTVNAQDADIFYFVSDDDNTLYTINRNTGVVVEIGATGRSNIEAIAYFPIPGSQTLYAADAGDFGTLNITTGAFTLIDEIDDGGTADGSAGAQTLNDVDGLMLDGQTLTMWAVERNSGNPDLLFQIDLVTGQFVPDAFGAGVDYLEITGDGLNLDVDDIAVDPISGEIYGVSNNGGSGDVLFKVNKSTGEFIFVTNLAESDVEGLAFSNNGNLYGSEGNANNRLSLINKATGAMTNFRSFDPGATGNPGDVEGLAALVADANLISGTVYDDEDLDGIKDGGETGIENVRVYLYVDNNSDGQVDPEDSRIQSVLTDVNGDYSFFYVTTGDLLTSTQAASYPAGFSLTTDNVETMSFTNATDFGETDANNNFGLSDGTDCDGDGLTDFFEGLTDSDGDGVLDQCDLDSDNDGILDSVEGTEDFDDDGVPNYLDRDSDDDGIPDAIEANGGIRPAEYVASQGNLSGAVGANGIVDTRETVAESGIMLASNPDSDNDSYKDYLDLDSDNDGILDLREAGATVDSDGDGQVDSIVDANGNGYADALESSPLPVTNTDLFYENSNGLTQRPNYIDIDSDADGIDDTREGLSTLGYRFPTLFGDNDDDGILNFWDVSNAATPITPVDTDLDGTPDYLDINSDNDSRSDFIEGNDTDDNGVADTANTGLDANGNGLDDAFDGDCAITTEETSTATDHAEEDNTDGSVDLASTDLELVNEDQNQTVGVYFPNVDVAQGATISSAYIQFEADEVQTGSITITIRGELSTNAGTFTTTTDDVSDRLTPGTTASESWSPADWNTIGESAAAQRTVDISSIIEEIVGQGGWSSGNAIVIIFTGPSGNRRTAEVDPLLVINTSESAIACSSNVAHQDTDTDGEDDFRDFEGVALDTDGDGVPDVDDIDDDNDGILDVDEGESTDTDGDGIVNSLDLDSDNDGILDIIEAGGIDTNDDGEVDTATDTDGDGWANTFDSDNGGTALANPDTDGDGINNFLDLDSDGDGIVDLIESQATTGTPIIPVGADSDGDGIDNAFDVTGGTPTDPEDTDSDGTPDYIDFDSDNDGFADVLEAWDTNGDLSANTVPTGIDSDLDGLDNAFDNVFGPNSTTNPYNSEDALDFPNVTTSGLTSERDWREDNAVDSDGDGQINSNDIDDDDDGILDVDEGLGDFDNDGVINSLDLDSDNDGIPDIIEAGGVDTDDDGRVDDNTDTDNDGWADTFDSDNGGTALADPDTDADGKNNYVDVDSDGDGIVDLIESQATTGSPITPSGTDTDGDGLDNSFDTDNGGTPTDPVDTDTDSTPDYIDLNSDNDSFTDAQEGWDTDGDLTADTVPSGTDSDNDGLDDAYDDVVGPNNTTNATNSQTAFAFPDVTTAGDSERDWRESNATDTDFDGIPDVDDIDDDNDGILDTDEGASTDTDGDGVVDRLDLDSDNDGIPDIIEAGGVDSDDDGRVDDDTDTDGDGWANTFDSDNGGTALADPDTDLDGINDYVDLDSDNDGIEDIIEAGGVDTDNDGVVDSATDTDGDGWANTFDGDNGGTVLPNPDTDADGLANNIDIDADGDGIVDLIESQATTGSPIIPTGSDSDGDGIDNAFDVTGGTPITPVDTDTDSTPDYIDFNSDNDSFSDALEGWDTDDDQVANTVPTGLDSDGDGLDNAYDDVVGPNDTNNVYNDQDANDFPDVSTSGATSERDWREVNVLDADFDGEPDGTDIDDDNDGILDVDELGDSDGDGIVDRLDLDSDNDGIPDILEAGGVDTDNDGRVDDDTDTDGDGWADTFDSDNGGTALTDPDSDNDGVENRVDLDSDNDGILDVIEASHTDANGDGEIDGFLDANGTGYADSVEGTVFVLPNTDLAYENANSLPNLPNYIDIDSDADGIDDTREGYSTDDYEFPTDFTDSDGDGILNFWDVDSGNTPIDPVDTDAAGLDDYVDTNSDNDFLSDFIEGNDFNGDGIADAANTGLDTNGNGLDDAFDQECYGTTTSRLSTDFAEEQDDDGTVNTGSSDLEFTNDGGENSSQTMGVYFPNITVPQGASINSAYIQFEADEVETGSVTITIEGELSTNAGTFTTTNDDVSDRLTPGTTASESWSPADWNTIGESGPAQRTVDISSIIEEIVGQIGWSSGNALVIIFTGADGNRRTAEVDPTIFINYGSGVTFCSSNVAHQDSDSDGEDDFRDGDGTAAPLDTDADGIADVDDIDDDNDGILDTVEGCTDTVITGANGSSASQTVATVTNTGNAINGVDATFATFSTDGAQMEVELRSGSLVVTGTAITIRAQRTNANILNRMTVSESTDGTNYVNTIEYSFAAEDTYEDKIYNLTTDATHIRITYLRVAGDLRVDNVSYAGFTIVCTGVDTDSDGIPDHLDIDADGDGIVDLIESQATTGTPVVPVGVDTDGDGLDDAFDGDCAPCGAVTGVPTVLEDTDGDLTPDFRDFNSDGDTFSDALEGWDTDGNLVANTVPSGTDTDGDGLDDAYDTVAGINSTNNVYNDQDANDFPDVTTLGNVERDWREVNVADSDFDGIQDSSDIDDDNDGILDVDETGDTDGDGIIDSLDLDSDNDGIPDIIEAGGVDTNNDGRVDDDTDTDNDGWADTFDSDNGGTALPEPDTDNDGVDDRVDLDSDNDGIEDIIEAGGVDTDDDGVVDDDTDLDEDGWANTFDSDNGGTALANGDLDGDGLANNIDIDADGDGIVDLIESQATTGTPVIPVGTDTDGDGIDNAFDDDNGGTPTTPIDTDGDNTPDYLDFNSDNDSFLDAQEGWDTDGDFTANTTPTGVDTDGDGLDNAYDDVVGPNSTTNVYNNEDALDFPDVTTSGETTERDWREANIIDSDFDGVADVDDIDDDNDGILDADEGNPTKCFITAVTSESGVLNSANITGAPDTNFTTIDTNGDIMVVDFGQEYPAGTQYEITWQRTSGESGTAIMVLRESTSPASGFVDHPFPPQVAQNSFETDVITSNVAFRYLEITKENPPSVTDFDIDAIGVICSLGTDTDNDGIPDRLDLDSDNDGILDIIESGGVDTDDDGRVDSDTDTDGDGWANTFDSDNGGTALTDPDSDTDDFENRIDIDSDDDGIVDLIESQATTGTPVIPVGVDSDGDGIDDAFDVNCAPCGGVTGVPTVLANTDGTDMPDYLDVDSDNDGLNDIIEAWDEDGDYLPDTTPTGTDSDDDGLDDQFDDVVGPNATTNNYNNQTANDFPDVTTAGATTERDWRETNEELCSPGAIDTNFLLWLKADNGGTSWRDLSNNYETVTAVGTLNNGSNINFNPTNFFDGTDYYNTTLSINADTYQDLAVIVVYQPAADNAGAVWGEDNGSFDRYMLDADGVGENQAVSNGTGTEDDIAGLYSALTTTMSTVIFDEDQSSGSSVSINGRNTLAFTSDHGGETSNNFQIGAKGDGSEIFTGLIAEVIVYNQLLTPVATRQRIESYLAIKYGITLSNDTDGDATTFEAGEGDYINSNGDLFWDASENTSFQNNVAGIARDDESCLNQLQSQSVNSDAIVAMGLDSDTDGLEGANSLNGSSFAANRSSLMWGHDGSSLYDPFNEEFDPQQVRTRLNREWRVQETGTVGTVTVRFDVSDLEGPTGIGTNDETRIILLVDADGDFSNGATVVSQSFVIDDDGFVSFQVDFTDGLYFTLASGELGALPITLLSFTGESRGSHVLLEWTTTSETDNSFFRVERSQDGLNFEAIGTVNGAGTTAAINDYEFKDLEPLQGTSYYRLTDVDINGIENPSEIISIKHTRSIISPKIYPNPAVKGESFKVDISYDTALGPIKMYDLSGKPVKISVERSTDKLNILPISASGGLYILTLMLDDELYKFKVIIK